MRISKNNKNEDNTNLKSKNTKLKKLKYKFAIPVIILISIILVAVSFYSANSEKDHVIESMKSKLLVLTELSSIAVGDPLWNLNNSAIVTFGESLFQDPEISYVIIKDSKGNELYNSYMDGNIYRGKYLFFTDKDVMRGNTNIGNVELGLTSYFQLKRVDQKLLADLIVTFTIIVFLLISIIFISNWITKPLKDLMSGTEEISKGNLSIRIPVTSGDEIGELTNKFNNMTENLYIMVSRVNESAQTIAASIEEITASIADTLNITKESTETSKHIAEGTEDQSVRLKTIASVINAMSDSVKHVTEDVNAAVELSKNSKKAAESGTVAVSETISKMKEICQFVENSSIAVQNLSIHSKKIVTFIDVITDITNQTNLLALNAAIEAARAGDAGRGFAVVATEVQKLAEESAEAAKQIATVVSNIQTEIEEAVKTMNKGASIAKEGTGVVEEAGGALNAIVNSTNEVFDIIQRINSESENQSKESIEIANNTMAISEIAHDTAASAEQTMSSLVNEEEVIREMSKAIEDLAKIAEVLLESVSHFSVHEKEEL